MLSRVALGPVVGPGGDKCLVDNKLKEKEEKSMKEKKNG